jgi:hypothetical protein
METKAVESKQVQYWNGFNGFLYGWQLEECAGLQEQRGWWAALDAQADCETIAINEKEVYVYTNEELEDMTYEMMNYQEEIDWNRRGGWQ